MRNPTYPNDSVNVPELTFEVVRKETRASLGDLSVYRASFDTCPGFPTLLDSLGVDYVG